MGMYGENDMIVTVNIKELLNRLKENRTSHSNNYEKSLTLWKTDLNETIQSLANCGVSIEKFPIELTEIRDSKPLSYVKQYDQVIDMFEMSVSQTVELTQSMFNTYCRDEWSWKSSTTSNKYYSSILGG